MLQRQRHHTICEIVAENDVCLATGHLSLDEIRALLDAATEAGVRRFIVTHANWSLWVEYDHIFRRTDALLFRGVGGATSFTEIVRRDFDKVLFGINYRFGGPVVARY